MCIRDRTDPEEKVTLQTDLRKLETEIKLHKLRADWFYKYKRNAKMRAKRTITCEAIAMDYGRNLPIPNIPTNDVYYKRQLSFYLFNIHVLASGQSFFYTYDQTVAKKGSDDVTSLLHHFIVNMLDPSVRELHIFCDSCSGQNKNSTMIRFLHYMAVTQKRFDEVTVTFPIRGHSYMEPDKNMGLINKRVHAEMPDDWREVIKYSRVKPSPFEVTV